MSLQKPSAAHVRKTLAHFDEILEYLKRRYSDDEIRQFAIALGVEDSLPDPIVEFDFERAA